MFTATGISMRGVMLALAVAATTFVAGDADAMSRKDKRTVVGAVVGGVAGSLMSNGDPAAIAGGALAGGAIGNLTTPERRDYRPAPHWQQQRWEQERWQQQRWEQRRWEQERRDRRDWERRHSWHHR